jgi:hypothetical protein
VSSSVRRTLICLSLFLLLFPLAVSRPGLPTHLKADESAYYLMALSLAHDGDLRVEVKDIDRLFQEFPFQPVNNLILMSRDGWRTVSFGKPYIYSLFAAPFAGLFGAGGLLFFNMLLTVAMVWMGALYLRRFNDDATAALFSAGFFLLSAGFAYVLWLQPEVFNMASVAACLFFGLPREDLETRGRRDLGLAGLSGAVLALSVYNKPMLAAIGLVPLLALARRRLWKDAGIWIAGAVVAMAAIAGLSLALTGTPTSYLYPGGQRGGFTVCEPGKMPVEPAKAAVSPAAPSPKPAGKTGAGAAAAAAESPTGNSMTWLFRKPDTSWSEFSDNVLYFLFGRHTGLLLYLPFAVLCVLLFLLHARRSPERWLLLGSMGAIALFFLLLIAWNWQGGGGFVGNRYFVNVYPGFLFLVTRIRPRAITAAGYALAGLFLTPVLFTPFGDPGPEPTLQAHVRNAPFRFFPLELTLRNVPGYNRIPLGGDLRLVGRRDNFLPRGEEFWVRGADPVELYLIAGHPLDAAVFQVRSFAPRNRIEVEMGRTEKTLDVKGTDPQRVELAPGRPTRVWKLKTGTLWAYRMEIETRTGRIRPWVRQIPPGSCPAFPDDRTRQETFFAGAEVIYLGSGQSLNADVYRLQWGNTIAPKQARAGETFQVLTRAFNRSGAPWPNVGGARVRLAYHWKMEDGREVLRDGERTELPQAVPPGGRLSVHQLVKAPAAPGRYVLELDPVFETVSWFSDRNGGNVFRVPIEVLPREVSGAR